MSQSLPPSSTTEDSEALLAPIEFQSYGRFQINNPAPHTPAHTSLQAAPFELGVETAAQHFQLPEQAKAHALALISQARRSLCIYSSDLEPWLYHQAAIHSACSQFLLINPANRLRILLADPALIIKEGHRLLTLARRLPSNCHIRILHPDYPIEPQSFLLADRYGLLLRTKPEHYNGLALYNDAGRVKVHQAQFDRAWDVSVTDANLRSQLL